MPEIQPLHSAPDPWDLHHIIAQVLQCVPALQLGIQPCCHLTPLPPLSWERKSTVPSSGILPPQALGIDFQRTIKNIARVFTEQHVFGLRVEVGYKGSLKGRQKRQRNRGVIKVQGITVCPCEENVDIDMFNVSWRTNTMKKGKLQMCFDYLKSDCCFHRWTVYPYFPRVHPAGWKMTSAIKFIRFIWF